MGMIRRRILSDALKLFDLAVMAFAFALATVPAFGVGRTISVAGFFSMRVKLQNFIIFFALLILWHVLFAIFGLYESHRMCSPASQSAEIVKATILGTLGLWCAALLFHLQIASFLFLILFLVFSTGILVCSRLVLRMVLAQARLHGRNLRNVLIVGTNPEPVEGSFVFPG
jgi:FlaA1/EpsC-like NDP-sugar epimerase